MHLPNYDSLAAGQPNLVNKLAPEDVEGLEEQYKAAKQLAGASESLKDAINKVANGLKQEIRTI